MYIFFEENTLFLKLLEHSEDTDYKLISSFTKISFFVSWICSDWRYGFTL